MKRATICAFCVLLLFACLSVVSAINPDPTIILRRGDANNDRAVDMTDSTYILDYLFDGGPVPPCMNQADANFDGIVNMSDATYILDFLFDDGAPPPAPGPYATECTRLSIGYLSCDVDPCQ